LTPDQPSFATAYIGKSVYSSEDPESDNIGDINDLILSEEGTITHAVVGVGGFLGIGEKNVAVPFDELKLVEKDGDIRFVYASTKESLEAAPALDRTAFDPVARAAAQETASTDTDADTLAPAPAEPTQDMAAAPADEPAAPAEQETAAAPAEEPAAPAEQNQDMAATTEQPAPADQATAPAETATAEQPAEPTAQTEQEVAANAPADTTKAPAEDMTAAPAEDQVAANTEADKTAAPMGDVEFLTANAEEILATDFIGKTVYGSDNKSIGEISDLVLEPEGKTRVALIDVGGFLGVGEKTVGLPFDQLEIYKAEDGSEQVKVAMSKEQLKQLPTMDLETAEAPAPLPTEKPAGNEAAAPAEQTAEAPAAAPAEPTMEEPAQTAEAPTNEQMTTGSIDASADYTVATQDVSANQLIGATVYGTDDSNIGEVHDVIFNENGDIDAAIIDVGGFLGIGEKPIGVKFSALNVRTDENGKLLVMINATKDQLDQAPKFEGPKTVK
jgi:sporulation protein YlmC with PRC-barrel domain